MSAPYVTVVVADSSVLINLIVTGRLALLGSLDSHRFVVPDEVVAELTWPNHRDALAVAIEAGIIDRVRVDAIDSSEILLALHDVIGSGELACLASAVINAWTVASDEKGRFRREAVARLGEHRLIGTVELYLRFIAACLLTVDEADGDLSVLANNRFVVKFASFRELMGD